MQIKKKHEPLAEPSTSSKNAYKNLIQNTLPSVINVLSDLIDACSEVDRYHEEEKKLISENAYSIFRAKCFQCSYSKYGESIPDCIHTTCALWKHRNVEHFDYIGIGEEGIKRISTIGMNKTRGDGDDDKYI